jgi:hypothetical protein
MLPTIDVYYRKCTGVNCTEELHYDGVEDGLTVMYMQSPNTMGKRLIAVDALLLNEFINNIHDSSGTLTELIRSINQGYAMEGLKTYVISVATFLRGIWRCAEHLVLPYIRFEYVKCANPTCNQNHVVGDAITLSIMQKMVPVNHTKYRGRGGDPKNAQQRAPEMFPSPEMVAALNVPADETGLLKTNCVPWNLASNFSGDKTETGEEAVGFALGKTQEKKGELTIPFDMDRAKRLRDNLQLNKADSDCNALTALVEAVINSNHFCIQEKSLRGVVQSFAAKSCLPVNGARGVAALLSYCHLACNMSGTDTLPKWCFLLLSPCALSIQTAKSVVEAPEDAPQPAWNELQQHQLLQCIDAIFMPYLSDVPEPVQISSASLATDASNYSKFVVNRTMCSLKEELKKQAGSSEVLRAAVMVRICVLVCCCVCITNGGVCA